MAKLNATPTQAATTLLKVMTLPLSTPVARSARPIWCADTQRPLSARHASPGTTAEPITDTVGVGSTQSSPDCTSSLASDVPTAGRPLRVSQKCHVIDKGWGISSGYEAAQIWASRVA